MSYIESIDRDLREVEEKIKRLQKVRLAMKRDKQKYCPHIHLMRVAKMPKLNYLSPPSVMDPVNYKITSKCVDCGKVFK